MIRHVIKTHYLSEGSTGVRLQLGEFDVPMSNAGANDILRLYLEICITQLFGFKEVYF